MAPDPTAPLSESAAMWSPSTFRASQPRFDQRELPGQSAEWLKIPWSTHMQKGHFDGMQGSWGKMGDAVGLGLRTGREAGLVPTGVNRGGGQGRGGFCPGLWL